MKRLEDARCSLPLRFPVTITNRPALSKIAYRIGSYGDFRAALLHALDKSSALATWTYRGADDPGIALLEGASILGDILTLYQEVHANEAFLRTAAMRESVSDLVRLLGYRLSAGLGGNGLFAFETRGDEPITVPTGFPVEAQLEDSELPAVFQTSESLIVHPALSRFALYRPVEPRNIAPCYSGELVIETDVELASEDRLLVGRVPSSQTLEGVENLLDSQVVIVEQAHTVHGRQIVSFRGSLSLEQPAAEVVAFKIGRTFRHFGHNAPLQLVTLVGTQASGSVISYKRELSGKTTHSAYIDPEIAADEIPLDVEVDDLSVGSQVAIALIASVPVEIVGQRTATALDERLFKETGKKALAAATKSSSSIDATSAFRGSIKSPPVLRPLMMIRDVLKLNASSMRWGAISGASTRLKINAALEDSAGAKADIRSIQVHEIISPPLRTIAKETEAPSSGYTLRYFGSAEAAHALDGRQISWQRAGNDPVVASVTDVAVDDTAVSGREAFHTLTLNVKVEYEYFPLNGPEFEIFGNLVGADQGKGEREAVLGNGDAQATFQTFALPKAPLTYHYDSDATPPQVPALTVYVEGRSWGRVESFFGHGPGDEIYVVREDPEGKSYVQFGDGKTGSRLPSGIRNVVAVYRTGNGARGELQEGTKVSAKARRQGIDSIHLIGAVSGGDDSEDAASARFAAPGKVQSLDRLVSIEDYERETASFAGVLLARARWAIVDGVPTLRVAALVATPGEEIRKKIENSLRTASVCRGADRFAVAVRLARFEYVHVDVEFSIEAGRREDDVRRALLEALGVTGYESEGIDGSSGLFSLRQLGLGATVYATQIEGRLQNVEGVSWARVVAFGSLGTTNDPTALAGPFTTGRSEKVSPADPDHVLRLYSRPGADVVQLRSVASLTSEGACGDER